MNRFLFPQNCKSVIDVTKPPYCADNTGKTDCTKILCKIVDDIMGAYQKAFDETECISENVTCSITPLNT